MNHLTKMINMSRKTFTLCLFLCSVMSGSDAFSQLLSAADNPSLSAGPKQEQRKPIRLKEYLSVIQQRYKVIFYYNDDILADKSTLETPVLNTRNIEADLSKVLAQMNLTMEKIRDNYYIITTAIAVKPKAEAAIPKGKTGQNLTWELSGKVTDSKNEGLPSATVLLSGTTIGTQTDVNGNYTLQVPEKSGTLIFSFISYISVEREFQGPGMINVTLQEDTKTLNEIVVTGYAAEAKKDIVGAVSVVNTKDLLVTPSGNMQSQLQGRASGVTISSNGEPGGNGTKVRIRGFGSFGNSDPLYVIDGVPTFDVSNINPQDIESMQILKDATSAAIYGARGANGVIVVTTKKGKVGRGKITIDSYAGIQMPTNFPELLNSQQLGDLIWTQMRNAGLKPTHAQYGNGETPVVPDYILAGNATGVMEGDPAADRSLYNIDPSRGAVYQIVQASKQGTDWFKELLSPALIQSHQLSASGGSESGSYSLGLNYFNQKGVIDYTGYKRYVARANTQFNIKKRIRVGENLQVSFEDNVSDLSSGGRGSGRRIYSAWISHPLVPVRDIMGNWAGNRATGTGVEPNPISFLSRNKDNKNTTYRIFGNIYAEVDLLKNLTVRSSFGLDYSTNYRTTYTMRTYENAENTSASSFNEGNSWISNWTFTNVLTYAPVIGKNQSLKVLLGTEAIQNMSRNVFGTRVGYTVDDVIFRSLNAGNSFGMTNSGAASHSTLSSLFGRVDYAFKDKYLINATLRRDGSSRFGPETRIAYFPAVGLGWRLSDELFLQQVTWISDLKLRGGWGQIGNQNGVSPENQYTIYQSLPSPSSYPINGQNNAVTAGYDILRIGNSGSKWETTATTNIGVDASLFKSKLNVSLEVYQRYTKDLLVTQQAALTSPYATYPQINIGDMKNRGIDLSISTNGSLGQELSYEVGLTFSHYRNQTTKVADNDATFISGGNTRMGDATRTIKGQPISSFYGYKLDGFFSSQEQIDNSPAQWISKRIGGWKVKDINGDGQINADDQAFIGSPHPDFQTGLNLSLRYKSFDLSTFLFWNQGNEIFNYNRYFVDFNVYQGNRSMRMLTDSWTPENPNAKLPSLNSQDVTSTAAVSDYFVEDGSYLRLKTMQLGYNLPKAACVKMGLDNLRLYLQAQNIFTLTKYTGMDPDVLTQGDIANGIDNGVYPNTKQFMIGLNLSF